MFYHQKLFVQIVLLSVVTMRISVFGAVGSLVLVLNLVSDGVVVFPSPILKEHFWIIPILPRGKFYFLLTIFLVICGTKKTQRGRAQ